VAGRWAVPVDEFEDKTGVRGVRDMGEYHTVAGFVLDQLGRLPKVGESFVFRGYRFEVVDMDSRRIDEVLVAAVPEADPALE
jgi:putative hemolysin